MNVLFSDDLIGALGLVLFPLASTWGCSPLPPTTHRKSSLEFEGRYGRGAYPTGSRSRNVGPARRVTRVCGSCMSVLLGQTRLCTCDAIPRMSDGNIGTREKRKWGFEGWGCLRSFPYPLRYKGSAVEAWSVLSEDDLGLCFCAVVRSESWHSARDVSSIRVSLCRVLCWVGQVSTVEVNLRLSIFTPSVFIRVATRPASPKITVSKQSHSTFSVVLFLNQA